MLIPFDDVGAKSSKKSDHREAQLISTTQHEASHDRQKGQLDIDAVPLS